MISLQNVVKIFGNITAVDGITFTAEKGEHVVLLGTSGCGKTTTLRMINRLIEVTSGSVHVAGKNVKEILPEQLRRNIGYVLQHNGLFPHYTVAENIAIVPRLLRWPPSKIQNRIEELLEQLQLPQQYLSLYPSQLSGGQQQRVGLARALAADPPVLLMDEPFGALDAITREIITKEFLRLDILKTKTLILVTHDIREAFEMGDKILLMDKGKIVQEGNSTELLFRPANQFVEDFFASQRMQLELTALKLKDVWEFLENKNSGEIPIKTIDDDLSLWDTLAKLPEQKKFIPIKNSISGEIRYADYNSLFEALEALKTKLP